MLKALIVDDEIASLRTLELLLGHFEQHIEIIGVAYSASEGIDKVTKYDPDIVFLDIEMQEVAASISLRVVLTGTLMLSL